MREIAQGAGVTAMLVNRYFGSKEGLFAEVVAASMADPHILTAQNLQSPEAARRMAEALVRITATGVNPLDGFLILLHSTASQRAAEIGRAEIEKAHLKTMTEALSGPDAATRAALILSLVAGFQVMRQMIQLPPLAQTDPTELEELLTRVLKALLQ